MRGVRAAVGIGAEDLAASQRLVGLQNTAVGKPAGQRGRDAVPGVGVINRIITARGQARAIGDLTPRKKTRALRGAQHLLRPNPVASQMTWLNTRDHRQLVEAASVFIAHHLAVLQARAHQRALRGGRTGKGIKDIVGCGVADRVDSDLPSRVEDRKSTRLNSSHVRISYAVFCLKKKKKQKNIYKYKKNKENKNEREKNFELICT